MLLQAVASAGLKCLPPRIFRRSAKKYNQFLLFLTAPQLRVCRNFSVSEGADIFDNVSVQKYLNYIASEATRNNGKPEVTGELISLLEKKQELESEIKNLQKMSSDGDKELEKLIETEKQQYLEAIEQMKSGILDCISPPDDDNDNRNVELQIIPGIGGEEAKLFSQELFNMYFNYAEFKNWEWIGDMSEGSVLINGEHVFGLLKQEAGVHRVQRVPVTESSGRVQSSTCSVVVLPQPRHNEIQISEKDITVERMRSSGPGGQNVNKRDTCVRIKHLPTGIVVENQTSRFQHENLKEAINRLRIILFNKEQDKISSERKSSKKEQVGVHDYSDKIRTYNFPQNRVTDHRINHTTQNLKGFLSGGKHLDQVIKEAKKFNSRKELLLNIKSTLESVEYKKFEKELAQ